MATNQYGKSCTPNLGGVVDQYTKAEVNSLLNAKANTSTVYTRAYIDSEFSTLSGLIAGLEASKVTVTQLNAALDGLEATITSDVASTYATLAGTYTKSEVDSLIAAIDLYPADYIRSSPATTAQNIINPGANNAIALTVRGSSVNPIVAEWRDSTDDRIGYVSNSGTVTFENKLSLGRLVSNGDYALDLNGKRITGVSVPVLSSDAVPYSTLQSYVLEFFEDAVRPDGIPFYSLDGGTY
jgi:hypothetical protein